MRGKKAKDLKNLARKICKGKPGLINECYKKLKRDYKKSKRGEEVTIGN